MKASSGTGLQFLKTECSVFLSTWETLCGCWTAAMTAAACVVRIDLVDMLRGTTLLSTQSPEEIQLLAARTVRRVFGPGELLFSEGEPGRGLHIIARGKVKLFKTSVDGREQVLSINQAGESVAELPVFDGGAYAVSAMAEALAEVDARKIVVRDFGRLAKIIGWPSTPRKKSEKQTAPSDLSLKLRGEQKTIEIRQASPKSNLVRNGRPDLSQRAQRAAKARQCWVSALRSCLHPMSIQGKSTNRC
jgi:hypothetical protein